MTNLFSFIGAGVVAGLVVGVVMGAADAPTWGAGAVAGGLATVAAWLLQMQARRRP